MVITIQCPSCETSFPVDPAKIPEGGVNARCSSCAHVFRVERPVEQDEPAPEASEIDIEAPTPDVASEEPSGGDAAVETAPPEEVEAPTVEEPTAEAPAEAPVEEPELEAGTFEVAAADEPASVPPEEPEPTEEAATASSSEEWVFETETELDASSLDIEPMGTVESTVEDTRDELSEDSFFGTPSGFQTSDNVMEEPLQAPETEEAEGDGAPEATAEPMLAGPLPGVPTSFEEPATPAPEPVEPPEEPAAAAPEPPAAEPTPTGGFAFGHRDPHDKARRLARVLVSDMIMYNPERHERALAAGTLKEDFDDEIQKSWKEYVDQVGEEIANETSYWPDALNDVLAKGQQIF